LVGWLANVLFGWLAAQVQFTSFTLACLVACLLGWSVGWLVGWLANVLFA
jgi:hypothetical protein